MQLEAKLALRDKDDGEVDGSMLLFSSVLSIFFLLSVLFFLLSVFFRVFCICISVRVLPVQSFLCSFVLFPSSSLYFSPRVAAEDGALELLLKMKYNGLTLCFPLLFFFSSSPVSLSPLFSVFFSLFVPPSLVRGLSLAFIRPENAMQW